MGPFVTRAATFLDGINGAQVISFWVVRFRALVAANLQIARRRRICSRGLARATANIQLERRRRNCSRRLTIGAAPPQLERRRYLFAASGGFVGCIWSTALGLFADV